MCETNWMKGKFCAESSMRDSAFTVVPKSLLAYALAESLIEDSAWEKVSNMLHTQTKNDYF